MSVFLEVAEEACARELRRELGVLAGEVHESADLYNGTEIDLPGEAAATMVTGAGTVTLTRASSNATATVPWTVIDFGHDCTGN